MKMSCKPNQLGWYGRIFNPRYFGECTAKASNKGISGRFDNVFLVLDSEQTKRDVETNNPDIHYPQNRPRKWDGKTPRVYITRIRDYIRAEPCEDPPKGHVGWMAGGSYIQVGSKFIPFHDRSDTQEELSRWCGCYPP